jgi:hypothetical protein
MNQALYAHMNNKRIKKKGLEAWLSRLLSKYKALNSNPSNSKKKKKKIWC